MKCKDLNKARAKPKETKINEQTKLRPLHLGDGHEQRFDRVKSAAPVGFPAVLEKVIRAVLLGRPVHVYHFIADFLDTELSRQTFNDLMYGCLLKKSIKDGLYPTESCKVLGLSASVMQAAEEEVQGEFTGGPIPECELYAPALDRYRELSVSGIFYFDDDRCCDDSSTKQQQQTFTSGPIPECDPQTPALDRYRDYMGIGEFCPDAVDDVDAASHDHLREESFHHPPLPYCTCTYCTLRAATKKHPHSPMLSESEDGFLSVVDMFTQGAVPETELLPPAEDRYRAEIEPFVPGVEYSGQSESGTANVNKSKGRSSMLDDELLTYREPTFSHERLFSSDENIQPDEPFGPTFQEDEPFQDQVFQPENPFGDKTFLEEHPLFGDFSNVNEKFLEDLAETADNPTNVNVNEKLLEDLAETADNPGNISEKLPEDLAETADNSTNVNEKLPEDLAETADNPS